MAITKHQQTKQKNQQEKERINRKRKKFHGAYRLVKTLRLIQLLPQKYQTKCKHQKNKGRD